MKVHQGILIRSMKGPGIDLNGADEVPGPSARLDRHNTRE